MRLILSHSSSRSSIDAASRVREKVFTAAATPAQSKASSSIAELMTAYWGVLRTGGRVFATNRVRS